MPALPARGLERYAPLAAGLFLAAPVAAAPYPPMSELPIVEAGVAILKGVDDAVRFPAPLYELHPLQANQLFCALALTLSLIVSTATACKLVVAASVGAIPLGAARLADHVGATRWSAALVAPLGLGWLFFRGVGGDLLGLALLLALLPEVDALVDGPTPRRAWTAAGAGVVLHLASDVMALLFAAGVVLFAGVRPRPRRAREVAMTLGPAAVVAALSLARAAGGAAPLRTTATTTASSWPSRVAAIPDLLFGTYDRGGSRVLFGLAAVVVVATAARRIAGRGRAEGPPGDRRARLHAIRFDLLAAGAWVAFLGSLMLTGYPSVGSGGLAAVAFALLAVVSSRRTHREPMLVPSVVRPFAAVIPVATMLVVWPAFVDSSRAYRDLGSLSRRIEPSTCSIAPPTRSGRSSSRARFGPRRASSTSPASGRSSSRTSPSCPWTRPIAPPPAWCARDTLRARVDRERDSTVTSRLPPS